MIRLAICEDNPETLEMLSGYTDHTGVADIDSYGSGDALLCSLDAGAEPYHIYLLDIEMPGRSGIETAAEIRRRDPEALLIFITDYKEYVYEVFEVLPFRFLRKPAEESAVKKVLEDAREHIFAAWRLFFFHVGHEQHQVSCGVIRYFESAGRRVILHTTSGEVSYYGRIADVPASLDPTQFARIHTSFIVNLEYVRAVRQAEVVVDGGQALPMSRKYSACVRNTHRAFMLRKGGLR